jgi:hypothetical protein
MAYHDDLDELLISQDELVIVCQTMMSIILDQQLQPLLDRKLDEASVQPGFAERSLTVQDKFTRERRKLMGLGEIR